MNTETILSILSIVAMPLIIWYFNNRAAKQLQNFQKEQEIVKAEYTQKLKEIETRPELLESLTAVSQNVITMFEPQLAAAQKIIAQQGGKIEELLSNNNQREKELKQQKQQIEALDKQVKTYEKEVVHLNSLMDDMKKQQDLLVAQNNLLKEELATLKNALDLQRQENARLREKITRISKEIETGSLHE